MNVNNLPKSIRLIFGSATGGKGEVSIETTQGVPENRAAYPEAAQRQVMVNGHSGVCVVLVVPTQRWLLVPVL